MYNNNIILIPLHRMSMGLLHDNQQRLMASNRNNEFIQTKTNILKTNMSMLKAVTRHGVRVGLLAGLLLLRLSLFLLMLSAAPGRFGRGLLTHAGRELRAYHWLESLERPGQLVGISQNGCFSSCCACAWSQEHSS